jgi:hypothetical protein
LVRTTITASELLERSAKIDRAVVELAMEKIPSE